MTEVVGDFCYNKKDLIGHGAFAVVFKGHHTKKEDFVVAIKVISKKNLSKTQNLLAKEIKILKELHHENVVALYDCQERPNNVYLVMEYCNGGDLADYLQAKGTLSEDTIRIFLKQIASAMGTLQSKGIMHRDLKPQNLLLSYTGTSNPSPSDIKIKIADFGFARFLPGEMMAATLCGSPMYMAPEVIMSKAYDAKADLWSLGTIVYQCLTGKAPFTANSPQALKKFYEKNKGICPNIPAGTSSHIKDLLTGLLKRNPKDRMDFGEFFSHPFLTGRIVQRSSTPVAVPSRHRHHSGCSQGTRSSGSNSPSYGAEALGDIRVDLLHRMTPPYDITGTSPQDPHPVSQGSLEHSPVNAYCNRGQRSSGTLMPSPPRLTQADDDVEPEDFVIVPNNLDSDGTPRAKVTWDLYFPHECQSSPPRNTDAKLFNPVSPQQMSPRSPPRRATFMVGSSSPNSPPTRPRAHSASNQPSTSQGSPRGMPQQSSVPISRRVRTNSSPGPRPNVSPCSQSSTPVPVPRKSSSPGSPTEALPYKPTQETGRKIFLPSKGSVPVVSRTLPSPSYLKGAQSPTDTVAPSLVTAVAKTFTDNSKVGFHKLANLNAVPQITADTVSMEPLGRPPPGTIRRALSNIEGSRNPSSSSPLLSALARQTNPGLVTLETLSEGTEARPILKVHSSPAILATAMGLHRNRSFGLLNTGQLQLGLSTSQSPRRHSSGAPLSPQGGNEPTLPTSSTPSHLPPIPGSPTKSLHTSHVEEEAELKPLRGLFTAGSSPPSAAMKAGGIIPFHSLPKYTGQEAVSNDIPALVMPDKGTKVTRGFSQSSSSTSHVVEPCSPEMEGTIALVAPDLPEDTLLETEHTDGVRKLSFALSLVDAILVVIRARGAPLTTLADSIAIRMNESVLTDQIGSISEECRTTEQLVLYLKALRISSLALRFAQEELQEHRLKPSNAVKNVVNDLNNRYRQCLDRTARIKSFLQSKSMTTDKIITANADKLMYTYAMELCQNAALDELFGNPKECREKYETAQLLLQGLEEDVKKDTDLVLLQKYKTNVDRRLTQLARRKTSVNVR
ncbi:serine/threonine-protein kinase ULK2-like [Actinia tenebrosa]|uniref:non-specific serine/threonine protein kinase n=1 Tax=Actinia tenebrosa TaxID=6105 RepID=A0A6P8IRW8_ACTTE|nr:serine/threonine-protein kinase ULK2-like [Actinia tenebrosa]